MKSYLLLGALVVACIGTFGCGQSAEKPVAIADAHKSESDKPHGDWWCYEHGVPEEICAQCSDKLAKEYKAKGDWCAKHDRPDSQCFICHPELETKFAERYEAKYGAKPPRPTEGLDEKKEEKTN